MTFTDHRPRRVRRLRAPLAFFLIRHESWWQYNIIYPLVVAAFTTVIYFLLPVRPPLMGDNGILKGIQDLLIVLVPLLIVALAAVATSDRTILDTNPAGQQFTVDIGLGPRLLTRREFVCYMLGYLTWVSLALLLAIFTARVFYPSLLVIGATWLEIIRIVSVFVFMLVASNLLITTLWSLFYLTDRLNRP